MFGINLKTSPCLELWITFKRLSEFQNFVSFSFSSRVGHNIDKTEKGCKKNSLYLVVGIMLYVACQHQ